jgi:hypothetical protein
MSGSGSSGPQQPTGSSYNFSYAAGTPPVGSSEYTYNAAVQDGRDSCYNMVYFPPNPTTGFNGHFSLVTPPQQHQETPIDGAVVNPAVTSSGQTMQDAWHPSSWASQAQATSNCNLMENNQHYSISTGFASQSDAEMALSTTGKFKSCTLLRNKNIQKKIMKVLKLIADTKCIFRLRADADSLYFLSCLVGLSILTLQSQQLSGCHQAVVLQFPFPAVI